MDYVQAAQRELLKRKAQKELAKRRLLDFLIYDGKGLYQEAKHINLLTDKLEQFVKDVEDGKISPYESLGWTVDSHLRKLSSD